jgi:hypothetical protein
VRVLDQQPTAIAIIDGYFESVPSVWHKEILLALESGVHVFGAASMGALRAAELDSFGMKGIGRIYRWFASGRLEDDDEVAVMHGPADHGYRELSEAMVNIRDRCEAARKRAVVSKRVSQRLVEIAKAAFYPDRQWPRILADARATVAERDVRAMTAFLKGEQTPSLKARDATALLRHVAAFMTRVPRPFRPRVRTERTKYVGRLLAEVAFSAGLGGEAMAGVQTGGGGAEQLALLRILVAREALHGGHTISGDDAQAVEDAFRRDLGLLSASHTEQWLAEAGLSAADFTAWMRDEALAARLRAQFSHAITVRAGAEARRLRARALAESWTRVTDARAAAGDRLENGPERSHTRTKRTGLRGNQSAPGDRSLD